MCGEIELFKLKTTINFDATKRIDSRRKQKILELYGEEYTTENFKDTLIFYKNKYLKSFYDFSGITIEENNINDILLKLNSIESIFGISINRLDTTQLFEVSFIIKDENTNGNLVNQTEMINKLIGSNNRLIKNIEFFETISNEIFVFIGISISPNGLKVKFSTDFSDVDRLKTIYDGFNSYIKDVLFIELLKEGE